MESKETNGDLQHATIFTEIIISTKNPEDRSKERLRSEARTLVSAGTDTTATTLAVAMYHILANPDIQTSLKAELLEAIPDPSSMPPLSTLETLPYLSAVIAESKFPLPSPVTPLPRLIQRPATRHYTPTSRSPRIARKNITYTDPLTSDSYLIPAGTPMGTSIYNLHRNASIFPAPDAFLPSRWLAEDSPKRYLVPFSKGTRNCLGMHLASAQLYVCLASLVRRCEMVLWETGEEAVRAEHDFFLPFPPDGRGVRVKVI